MLNTVIQASQDWPALPLLLKPFFQSRYTFDGITACARPICGNTCVISLPADMPRCIYYMFGNLRCGPEGRLAPVIIYLHRKIFFLGVGSFFFSFFFHYFICRSHLILSFFFNLNTSKQINPLSSPRSKAPFSRKMI